MVKCTISQWILRARKIFPLSRDLLAKTYKHKKKKKRLKETSIFGGISNGIIWGVEFPSAALDSKKAENYNM